MIEAPNRSLAEIILKELPRSTWIVDFPIPTNGITLRYFDPVTGNFREKLSSPRNRRLLIFKERDNLTLVFSTSPETPHDVLRSKVVEGERFKNAQVFYGAITGYNSSLKNRWRHQVVIYKAIPVGRTENTNGLAAILDPESYLTYTEIKKLILKLEARRLVVHEVPMNSAGSIVDHHLKWGAIKAQTKPL